MPLRTQVGSRHCLASPPTSKRIGNHLRAVVWNRTRSISEAGLYFTSKHSLSNLPPQPLTDKDQK